MLSLEANQELIDKYGVAVPRYTSYPTAPEWKHEFSSSKFQKAIQVSNEKGSDYSLYLHIPFCESQCYYCACNVVISKKKSIAEEYLTRIKEEIEFIGSQIDKSRKVIQMAWGGGTPTYLSPEQIEDLYEHISKHFSLIAPATHNANLSDYKHEYAIEIDPRVTSLEHIETLYKLGFNRLSMGIQDFNQATQENINRIQSKEMVANILKEARKIGFKSINFDLIYGLPFQTIESFRESIQTVIELDPDRIALFNYAHIPSLFPFQNKYILDHTLPDQQTKSKIFDLAVASFTEAAYEFIGLDHFAKADDELSIAHQDKKLYRNFQGYTTHDGCDLFGLGITAISDVQGVFKQNHKKLANYYESFGADKFLVASEDDIERRQIIKELMCHLQSTVDSNKYSKELELLKPLLEDSLLQIEQKKGKSQIKINQLGRLFIRNIASCFDHYLKQHNSHKVFSKSL